jgi:hypothetical protein
MPNPQQRLKLRDALISAFPERSSLDMLLYFKLDKNLSQITPDSNLETVIFKLIQTAEAEEWLLDLVSAARENNPGNSQLKAIANELLINNFSLDIAATLRQQATHTIAAFPTSNEHCEFDIFLCQNSEDKDVVKKLKQEHKYPTLVSIDIQIITDKFHRDQNKFLLILDISFGEVEEKFKYRNQLEIIEKEGWIRFGIKFGELCLKLTNGQMPLKLRKVFNCEKVFGILSPTGTDECPIWQFKVDENKHSTLFGGLQNQNLGIIAIPNNSCSIEATFQIHVNSNNLEVTAQEGVWNDTTNKKEKETKRRAFFKKVVEPKLKDYVSKVVLQYDSTSNS